jgi:hypothetical protein
MLTLRLFWSIALGDCFALCSRQLTVDRRKLLGVRDRVVRDFIDEIKQCRCRIPIIRKVHLAGMHRFVSDHPHDIQRLLHAHIQSLGYQARNIGVDILSRFPKMNAKLLNAEPQQGGRSPWGKVQDTSGLVEIPSNIIWQIRVGLDLVAVRRIKDGVVMPDCGPSAAIALTYMHIR